MSLTCNLSFPNLYSSSAARGAKADILRTIYANLGYGSDKFEAISISDIMNEQFPEAFKGVSAVIHSASPLPGRTATLDETLTAAVEGTLNVIRQAQQAGIKRIVVTGSISSVRSPTGTFTDKGMYG
jgi:nucleoside-diphosphate-sugar epimerase